MADALASGASVLRDVGVQVPLRPQVVWAGKPNDKGRRPYGVSGLVRLMVALNRGSGGCPYRSVSSRLLGNVGSSALNVQAATLYHCISLHIAAFGYECSCTECGLALVSP